MITGTQEAVTGSLHRACLKRVVLRDKSNLFFYKMSCTVNRSGGYYVSTLKRAILKHRRLPVARKLNSEVILLHRLSVSIFAGR